MDADSHSTNLLTDGSQPSVNGVPPSQPQSIPRKSQDRQRLYDSISAASSRSKRISADALGPGVPLHSTRSAPSSAARGDDMNLGSLDDELARHPGDQPHFSNPYTQNPTVDFDGLSWPSVGTRARLDATPEEAEAREERLKGALRTVLECIGEDPDRNGLLDTPERYAKSMMFYTKGYEQNLRDIVSGAVFDEDHDELVIVKDIEVFSLCEHHLVPFTGKVHIGYIPRGRVLGLSKLARIAEMFARRLQVQERMTKQVALAIDEVLKPKGVAVVMECTHMCMVMRGVEKTSSKTTTSCMLGCMRSRDRTRAEFLTLLDRK